MANPIQVKSLDHVTLVVKDLELSRRFYVDGLGMREVPRPAFSFPGSWFQAGPTLIHLIGNISAARQPAIRSPKNFARRDRTTSRSWSMTLRRPTLELKNLE